MIVKELAQALNKVPGKIVDELRRQYPRENWTVESQVPEEILAKFQDITNRTSQTQQPPIAPIAEATIIKSDEAIQQVSHKLTAADREIASELLNVQNELYTALGTATGITSALTFMNSCTGARGDVLDAYTEQTISLVDEQLAGIDQSIYGFAEEATKRLGETIRKKQRLQLRLKTLKERAILIGT
ncbi:hypothetical protein IQ246_18215 [aff. Roholtiella sp. LEGE 12411]|uniref:hypothetical protein n=1 Tax=aff. Roholtiella sp. LEGE 12411 TaxID=1828822 RepID=UPI0018811FC0|nr:hypothetical protein [aff. Roholtiella sp. LEGE 12411]MBE9037002.1 hypothetical protein [aff. Roholtiella sp. LEGE 12411]